MEELTIGEVARQAGIRPSALRYYESIGLLPAPKRVNGRRRYDPSTVQQLTVLNWPDRLALPSPKYRPCFTALHPRPTRGPLACPGRAKAV